MTKDELITVSTYANVIDAHMAKNKLESEGILVFLFDENMVSLNPLYNILVGGIKLKTLRSDAQQAQAILQHLGEQPYTNDEDEQVQCPRCNSTSVSYAYESGGRLKTIFGTLLALLTSSLPFFPRNNYQCSACGMVFKPA